MHGDERKGPSLLIEAVNCESQYLFAGTRLSFQQDRDVADASGFVNMAQQWKEFLGSGHESEFLKAPAEIVVCERGTHNSHWIASIADSTAIESGTPNEAKWYPRHDIPAGAWRETVTRFGR